MKKGAAIYSILMGLAMFGTWIFLFSTGEVPQLKTLQIETIYLLLAEFLTAASLVAAGAGVLANKKWGMTLLLVGLGQLMYCAIRFAGELGQEGANAGLAFFSVVGAASLMFSIVLVFQTRQKEFGP